MKRNKQGSIYTLILMGLVLTFINSCKKDETVNKEEPVVVWENPEDIFVGTPLSATQLNASAYVNGTFIYNPPIGTVLSIGNNQKLSVDFTPTDAVTYTTASKTVNINVVKRGISNAYFNPNLTYGSMTDQDGNTYKTITIGTQTWMAENLITKKYRNGDPITKVDKVPYYPDDAAWAALTTEAYSLPYINVTNYATNDQIATYGLLYNWFAVTDNSNLAPAGWHIPTDAEWKQLTGYISDNNVAGGKLKEAGVSHWMIPNEGATNETGFTALPSGIRYPLGDWVRPDVESSWWCDAGGSTDSPISWSLGFGTSKVMRNLNLDKRWGLSVRCVKD
jgi:uncharacterized protein (TIGR02145 family)